MTKLFYFLVILAGFCFAQEYELQNAFPNLTFSRPVFLTHSPDSSNRIFVLEQDGLIKVFPNDPDVTQEDVTTFLDITDRLHVNAYDECGLLGLAFHPDFKDNGIFFIDYVDTKPQTVVSRLKVSDTDSNKADLESETILITADQPRLNHNAGMLAFGTDNYLYISLGDGGFDWPDGQPDPAGNSQNLHTLLASILRIDVDSSQGDLNYSIPKDNPFYGNDSSYREEIYAYGFRNPWRFSVDPVDNRIWVADVGLSTYEEIDLLKPGRDYGWVIMEGPICLPGTECDTTGLELPIYFYGRDQGGSIAGGYVYRGSELPELYGKYIFGDYVSGQIWALDYDGETAVTTKIAKINPSLLVAFGQDENKELYAITHNWTQPTSIYRLKSVTVGLKNTKPETVAGYKLSQNYPNPFNPTTVISYQLARTGQVSIKVYDTTGNEIATLVNDRQNAGLHKISFDGSGLAAGVYFYKMKTAARIFTKKMILLP